MPSVKRIAFAVALVVLAACGGAPTEPSDFEFGRVDVYVRDTAGQPINGAPVRLERPGGQTEDAGGPTGSAGLPGYYFFLRTGGQYRVVITPPAGYQLPAGQTGTQMVTFARNQLQTVNFVLNGGG
jgi:hypothetical protein